MLRGLEISTVEVTSTETDTSVVTSLRAEATPVQSDSLTEATATV